MRTKQASPYALHYQNQENRRLKRAERVYAAWMREQLLRVCPGCKLPCKSSEFPITENPRERRLNGFCLACRRQFLKSQIDNVSPSGRVPPNCAGPENRTRENRETSGSQGPLIQPLAIRDHFFPVEGISVSPRDVRLPVAKAGIAGPKPPTEG